MNGFTTAIYVSSYYISVLVQVIEETEKEYAMLMIGKVPADGLALN